jgi:hypothetical protein
VCISGMVRKAEKQENSELLIKRFKERALTANFIFKSELLVLPDLRAGDKSDLQEERSRYQYPGLGESLCQ